MRHAVALAALVLMVSTACNSGPALTQGPRLAKDQTLHVLLDDQPQSLDPGQSQYSFETSVLRVISEPLLRPAPDLSTVTSGAAASWEATDNGTVYVFHLRKNAGYSDGQPVKAQDFVFAWQRLIDPRLAAPNETFFASAVLNGDKVSVMDPQRDASRLDAAVQTLGLKAVDDSTFQVTLSHPDPSFVWIAAMPAGAPIRADVVAKHGDKWATAPESLITNGPFEVAEMVAKDHLKVVPNAHYWGPRPKLASIVFSIVNDGAAALARYSAGGLDEMVVQPAQAAAVVGDAKLSKQLVKTPALTVYWIVFRVTSPRLANAKVRLALAEAIDREAFVSQIFQGQGTPAETFLPKGMNGYTPGEAAIQKFDVAQARATLASSGVSAAQLSGLRFSFDLASDFSKSTATFVHDQLKLNLGIDIALEPLDANTLDSRLSSGDFDIAGPQGWTADFPDPANWFGIFTTTNSNNLSLYQNKQYDSLVTAAAADMQPARRVGEYQQAQKNLLTDAPAGFLAQAVSWYLLPPYVRGVTTTPVDDWPGVLFPTQIYIGEH
jgi:oligopeptide transport system substrate-binding protein